MNDARVDVDWTPVERGMRQLASGVESGSKQVATDQAERTADRLRAATPVRSGRLASTIGVVTEADGAAVTYGGSLPYAGYIARRTSNVARAVEGALAEFGRAETEMARREVKRL